MTEPRVVSCPICVAAPSLKGFNGDPVLPLILGWISKELATKVGVAPEFCVSHGLIHQGLTMMGNGMYEAALAAEAKKQCPPER